MNDLAEFDAQAEALSRSGANTFTIVREFGVTVPWVSGPKCGILHPNGWRCSRSALHSGRHAAAMPYGEVCAVWRADR